MGRPRADANREDTRERILRSALAVFARDGFAQARLADIAAGAEIRRPSLLYHFTSKERLYEAVVERSFGRLGGALAEAMATDGPVAEQLEALVRRFTGDLADHPDDARVVVREMLSTGGPGQELLAGQVAPLLDRVVGFLEARGAGAFRPGLPVRAAVVHVIAHVLLGAAARPPLGDLMLANPDPDVVWALTRDVFLAPEA